MSEVSETGRFVTGSIMRHVIVMTLTGALGLIFLFLVEAATLFWVSQLGDLRLVAALGFSWTIIFFVISVGIGLSIAATALVSRAIGEGRRFEARRIATAAMVITFVVIAGITLVVIVLRSPILSFAGASGETHAIAARFLLFTLPAMPLMVLGMTGSAVLRALGDAWRSMNVMLSAGAIAVVLDPVFIFWLDLGIDGAAFVMFLARSSVGILALIYLVRVHDMLVPVGPELVTRMLRPFFGIALPASATQLSTPFGNYLLTLLIAQYGDSAVAGWTVVSRLTVLAFGGIYSLSGALSGIIGQNFGAGLIYRVQCTFRDALVFSAIYTFLAWGLLFLLRDTIITSFGLDAEGASVVSAFVGLAAGGFVFTGALFCANAAFNTLGRPLWSTGLNWLRDGVLMFPIAASLGATMGATGVIYGQALAGVFAGLLSAILCWRFVGGLAGAVALERA